MKIVIGLAASACAFALCGAAGAGGARSCASPAEVAAMRTAAIQQQLMDAALTCGDVARDKYNAFQTTYSSELRTSDKTMLNMFTRVMGGRKGDAAYNSFKTDLASRAELRRLDAMDAFCAASDQIANAALVPNKPTLDSMIASVEVVDTERPVSDCGTAIASAQEETPAVAGQAMATEVMTLVPRPRPTRVAMASAAAPEAGPSAGAFLFVPRPRPEHVAAAMVMASAAAAPDMVETASVPVPMPRPMDMPAATGGASTAVEPPAGVIVPRPNPLR